MKIQASNDFSVQRKVIASDTDVRLELHGYCDVSERAYGACVYIPYDQKVPGISHLNEPRLRYCQNNFFFRLVHLSVVYMSLLSAICRIVCA